MASPCIIVFKGKEYDYPTFAKMLHDGMLNEFIDAGTIKGIEKFTPPKAEAVTPKIAEEVKAEPTPSSQLGTGANVYFETDKYRVNEDSKSGKTVLNVGDKNGETPLRNILFEDKNEAVFVAKKLAENAPEGLTDGYHNIDGIIDNYKKEYKEQKLPVELTKNEVAEAGKDLKVEAKKIAEEHGYEHQTKLLNSIEKNTGERFMTVQDAIASNNPKVKEFLKGKKEAKPKELTERQKKQNLLEDLRKQFNELNNGKQGKDTPEGRALRERHDALAKELGYEVKGVKSKGIAPHKGLKRTLLEEEKGKGKATQMKPISERSEPVKKLADDVLSLHDEGVPILNGLDVKRPDGKSMSNREITQALKDLKEGNNTNNAKALLDGIDNMFNNDSFELIDTNTRTRVGVTRDEFLRTIEDARNEVESAKEYGLTYEEVHDNIPEAKSIEEQLTDAEVDKWLSESDAITENITNFVEDHGKQEKQVKSEDSGSISRQEKSAEKEVASKAKLSAAREKLSKSKTKLSNKLRGSAQMGGLNAIPEFVEYVKDYVAVKKAQIGYAGDIVKDFIDDFRKAMPNSKYTDEALRDAFEGVTKEKKVVEEAPKREVKKTVVTKRSYEGDVREELKKQLEEAGLNRETFSPQERSLQADKIIEDIGEDNAIEAVRKGDVTGAVANSIISKVIKSIDDSMKGKSDAEKIELAKKQAELLNLKDKQGYQGGEFNSQSAYEYVHSDIGYNLATMLKEKQESLGVDKLTDAQKEAVIQKYNEISEAKVKAEAKVAELEKKVSEYEAQKNIRRFDREKRRAVTKEKLDVEFSALSEEFSKIAKSSFRASSGGDPVLAAKAAMIVTKMAKNRVEKGIVKLSEVIDSIYDKVKDSGLSKEDINDIIGGKYSEKKTRSEITKIIAELKTEARKNIPYGAEDVIAAKKRIETTIKKWEKKIADKDYATAKRENIFDDPIVKTKFAKERKEALDAIVKRDDTKHQWAIDKANDALKNRNLAEKTYDWGMAGIHTARAIKAGIDDSFSYVQAGLTSLTHPKEFGKAWLEHVKNFTSEKRFDRELAAVHNAPYWDLVKKAELDILEPKTMKQKESEGITEYNLLNEDFEIGGKKFNVGSVTTRPFERMFISMGNNLRLNIFLKEAQTLIDEGKTFDSHPQEFKSLATVVNNMTARGKIHRLADNDLVRVGVWAPKMLASGLNVLGVSDVVNPLTRQKGYYAGLTPRMRKYAATQTAKGIGIGLGVMGAVSFAGGYSDFDPRSVTFGETGFSKEGNHINIFGRFAPIVRLLAITATGKKVYPEGAKDRERWREVIRFGRGKLSPHAGLAIDAMTGETYMGAPFEWEQALKDQITPMSFGEISKAMDEEGITPMIRSILSIEGMKTSKASEFKDLMKENELKKRRKKIEERREKRKQTTAD